MDGWLPILVITVAALIVIGNFSTFQKSSKQKLRKKGLNDLEETLPRANKKKHTMRTSDKN